MTETDVHRLAASWYRSGAVGSGSGWRRLRCRGPIRSSRRSCVASPRRAASQRSSLAKLGHNVPASLFALCALHQRIRSCRLPVRLHRHAVLGQILFGGGNQHFEQGVAPCNCVPSSSPSKTSTTEHPTSNLKQHLGREAEDDVADMERREEETGRVRPCRPAWARPGPLWVQQG